MQILSAIVLLGVLIFVHELGHFLFAKGLGIPVLKFSLGFGPRIWGFRKGETEYQLAAVPLGGFVKMLGEEPGEELDPADRARAFNNQSVWKRMSVVAAGPIFNILFSALLFTLLIMTGMPALTSQVGEVMEDTPAMAAGIQAGDRIIRIDDQPIERWDELSSLIHDRPGRKLVLEIDRKGTTLVLSVVPETRTVPNLFGEDTEVGLIGITPSDETVTFSLSFPDGLAWAVEETWHWCEITVLAIVKIFQNIVPAKTIGGPILIMQMAGKTASLGAQSFIHFMAIISINLGILNLFPIPILDGGHLLFMVIEAVRGKPVNQRVMEMAQKTGLFVILAIMVFALYNDILRVFSGGLTP